MWLAEHDPEYVSVPDTPGQEIPFGGDADLEMLVEAAEGRWLPGPYRKACAQCSYLFTPNTPWQRFCEDKCKKRAWRSQNNGTHS